MDTQHSIGDSSKPILILIRPRSVTSELIVAKLLAHA